MKVKIQKLMVLITGLMLIAFIGIQSGCEDHDPINADGLTGPATGSTDNEPPETYLSVNLSPGQMPDTTTSSKEMHWWGEDVDGRISAYRFRWGQIVDTETVWYDTLWNEVDDTTWTTTTSETQSFILPIRTLYANFVFEVRAVDNNSAIDPEAATAEFPIVNSPPDVSFRDGANPTGLAGEEFYTYPVRSFVWDATDPDGNESIEKTFYALDPVAGDTNWIEIPGGENSVTLLSDQLDPGEHSFVLKVSDVAGLESPVIMFPDPENNSDPSAWVVKEPQGDFLIVDDYYLDSPNNTLNFYKAIFDSIYGEEEVAYSTWELGNQLPYVTQDMTETFMMFKKIFLFSYFGTPLVSRAFSTVSSFLAEPDNQLVITATFVDTSMYSGLADSMYTYTTRMDISDSDPIILEPVDDNTLPQMEFANSVRRPLFGFIPSSNVDVIYKLDESTHTPPWYQGEPIVGLRRTDRKYTLISIPMHELNDPDNIAVFLQNTFD